MPRIHATAIVAPGAELAEDVVIGPYCVVGRNVRLGARVSLGSHAVVDGHTRIEEAEGNGPVDAVFNCIKSLVPHEARLELYQVHAVTEGTDAQAEVSVRLSHNGRSMTARAASVSGTRRNTPGRRPLSQASGADDRRDRSGVGRSRRRSGS